MEFDDVVRRRRMVRRYTDEPVPREIVDGILQNALRAPSAGFTQGTCFLVLDTLEDIVRFRASVTPLSHSENWYASSVDAPVVIVPLSDKSAYLDRYAQPDKGFTSRSDTWWPAPYWDIDAGMAALLILLGAVDRGLGACFFGLPKQRTDEFRAVFSVPSKYSPIGAISIGYPDEQAADLSAYRKSPAELIHRGHWGETPGISPFDIHGTPGAF